MSVVQPVKTRLLQANRAEHVAEAARLLKAGELVTVPTETVYGLAADATNPTAVAAIFSAKNRPANHPLITHLGSTDQLARWARNIPDWVEPLVRRFWPGPLTSLLDKPDGVSDVITGGLRIPDHPVLLHLLNRHGLAVAAPSANPYRKLGPTCTSPPMAPRHRDALPVARSMRQQLTRR